MFYTIVLMNNISYNRLNLQLSVFILGDYLNPLILKVSNIFVTLTRKVKNKVGSVKKSTTN